MESQPNRVPVSHEQARVIITRLLAESRENLRQMEESFAIDPGIQVALARLERKHQQQPSVEEQV